MHSRTIRFSLVMLLPLFGHYYCPYWPPHLSGHCYCLLEPRPPLLLSSSRLLQLGLVFLGLMASSWPTAKGKQIFMPCTYFGKTTHASEKCWKEFGKPEWAQGMFSYITLSSTPPSISTPPVELTIQMTFTPAEYEAWKQS